MPLVAGADTVFVSASRHLCRRFAARITPRLTIGTGHFLISGSSSRSGLGFAERSGGYLLKQPISVQESSARKMAFCMCRRFSA